MKQVEHTDYSTDKLEEFLKVTIQMPEEELKALEGVEPMTQQLFESCIEKCIRLGAKRQFQELVEKYSEMFQTYAEKLGENVKELSPESLQTDSVWKNLVALIK